LDSKDDIYIQARFDGIVELEEVSTQDANDELTNSLRADKLDSNVNTDSVESRRKAMIERLNKTKKE
jgi:hypothetical protein